MVDGAVPPSPPQDFAQRDLASVSVPRRRRLFRIHRHDQGPLHYGRSGVSRFDDPQGLYGVCYLGFSANAAFAETFLRRPGATLVDWHDLAARSITACRVTETLRAVRLHGPGLAKMGATAGVTHGPHDIAHAWSRAIHDHPARPDAIVYRARHDDDERCVALFERPEPPIELVSTIPLTADPRALGALLDRYGVGIVGGPS